MAKRKDVWVVIAAFNEEATVGSTVEGLAPYFSNIVVVDDCSRDATMQEALRAGAAVCRHPVNLGQGAALQTGITYALRQGAGAIVTFDADGQHSPSDAEAMVRTLEETGCDVVLGSRFIGAVEGMPYMKRLVLRAAILFTRLTAPGLRVTDTHNGLRVFSRRAASLINIRHNRMAHASEILAKIHALGLRYVEAPCTIRYTAYSVRKGQRLSGAFAIVADLALGKLHK